jgi:hypothetical protein
MSTLATLVSAASSVAALLLAVLQIADRHRRRQRARTSSRRDRARGLSG